MPSAPIADFDADRQNAVLHGCVVLMADVEMQEPSTFWDFISRHDGELSQYDAAAAGSNGRGCPSTVALHRTILGGRETLPSLHHRLRERLGKVPIINTYGPTECCIDATAFVLDDIADETRIPIGRPLANYALMSWTLAWSLCLRGLRASFTSRVRGWRAAIWGGRG